MSNLVLNPYNFPEETVTEVVYTHNSVGDTDEDGYTQENTSGLSTTGVAVIVGLNGGDTNNAFWLFKNVTIPVGATITSATFTNVVRGDFASEGRTATWNWRGVKELNPSAPSSYSDYHSRTLTTATVAASRESPYADETVDTTENLADIFQEIIDQASWASGNNIMIYALRTGGNFRWSYDSTNGETRTLTVEYTI